MLLSGAKTKEISSRDAEHHSIEYLQNEIEHDNIGSVVGREGSGTPVSVITRNLKNVIKGRVRRNHERSIV